MPSSVLVSLRVRARPDRAFEVFTREIALWWQPNQLIRITDVGGEVLALDAREGGALTATTPNGDVFEIGRITVWEPPSRLVFSWRQQSFRPDQTTEVDIRFESVGDGETRVTVQHFGWDAFPPEHAARHGFPEGVFLRRLGEWWTTLISAMARRIER